MMGPGQQVGARWQAAELLKWCWKAGPCVIALCQGCCVFRDTRKVPAYTHPHLALSRALCWQGPGCLVSLKALFKGEGFYIVFNS